MLLLLLTAKRCDSKFFVLLFSLALLSLCERKGVVVVAVAVVTTTKMKRIDTTTIMMTAPLATTKDCGN